MFCQSAGLIHGCFLLGKWNFPAILIKQKKKVLLALFVDLAWVAGAAQLGK